MLNRKQKIVVWAGLGLILVMGLYPPWIECFDSTRLKGSHLSAKFGPRAGGYYWIFLSPPVPKWAWEREIKDLKNEIFWNWSVDATRLLIQWAMVCFAVGGLLWTLKTKTPPGLG